MPAIGDKAPTFVLPDTGGASHEPDGAPATVVVFTCNHCPYALAWHDRIIEVASGYADRGVRVLAINPNDSERYPSDSTDAMRARVDEGEFDGVPYLRDESQEVARAYDARTTPSTPCSKVARRTRMRRVRSAVRSSGEREQGYPAYRGPGAVARTARIECWFDNLS